MIYQGIKPLSAEEIDKRIQMYMNVAGASNATQDARLHAVKEGRTFVSILYSLERNRSIVEKMDNAAR